MVADAISEGKKSAQPYVNSIYNFGKGIADSVSSAGSSAYYVGKGLAKRGYYHGKGLVN